ncbi:MAG TPA: hypothetical protein VHZ95_05920, partial [Polyangiales bacterium]|nr:hypothetical protein [Polyangiales bacterium]
RRSEPTAVDSWRDVRALTCLALIGLALLNACHGGRTNGRRRVTTIPPDSTDAGVSDASVADAGRSPRGPTPIYPTAESEIVLPYRGAGVPDVLVLDPSPAQLDLHMNVDTTASFGDEIDALQHDLARTIIPQLRQRVADASFGVSRFADFPITPFGRPGLPPEGDQPFVLLTPVTDSLSLVTTAVGRLDMPLGFGADDHEAGAESLYQVATGVGYTLNGRKLIAPFDRVAAHGGGTIGGVGFRGEALRVVLHVTDAQSHVPADYAPFGIANTHGWDDVIDAFNAIHVHALAIISTNCESDSCRAGPDYVALRNELSNLAYSTGATRAATKGACATGIDGANVVTYQDTCPLVFDVAADGSGLANTISDAVVGLLDAVRFDEVHAEVGDDPLSFIQRIEASPIEQPAGVNAPATVDRLPSGMVDGVLDTYLQVERRNRLGFKVTLRNGRIAPSDVAQHFRVSVRLFGDGSLLEERFLGVVVPPLMAADADAGADLDGG